MRLSAPHRLNKMAETGRFLTGSTMGHVVRMTATGAAGITFVFAVGAANLLWLSQLGGRRVVAAIGFAYDVQETDAVPREQTDQKLDLIVTESGIRTPS